MKKNILMKRCFSVLFAVIFTFMSIPSAFSEKDVKQEAQTAIALSEKIEVMVQKGMIEEDTASSYEGSESISKSVFMTLAARLFRQSDEQLKSLMDSGVLPNDAMMMDADEISRENAAKILYSLFVYAYEHEASDFASVSDISEAAWDAQNAIKGMCGMGFMAANGGNFRPKAAITKSETIDCIYNMFFTDEAYTLKAEPGESRDGALALETKDAYDRGARKVIVKPGTYYLYNRVPFGNQNSYFAMENMKDFILEGYNVKFICCIDENTPEGQKDLLGLTVYKSENITVRGFTIDYEHILFTQGEVVSINTEGENQKRYFITIDIDEGYPNYLKDTEYFPDTVVGYIYDRKTHLLKEPAVSVNIQPKKVEGYERRWKCESWAPGTLKLIEPGDLIAFRMSNCGSINTKFSVTRNCVLEDHTIMAGNFGLQFEPSMVDGTRTPDNPVIRNVKVTYGEKPKGAKRDRLMSTMADGIHLTAIKGRPLVEDCLVEGNCDDAYSLNGKTSMITEVAEGESMYYVGSIWFGGICEAGDTAAIYDSLGNYKGVVDIISMEDVTKTYEPPEDATGIGDASLGNISEFSNYHLMKIKSDFEIEKTDRFYALDGTINNYTIRNCIARDTRGRAMLLQGWNGLIENSKFYNCSAGGISVEAEDHCAQGPFATNITMRNCELYENGNSASSESGEYSPHASFISSIAQEGRANENIVIDSCYFHDNYGTDIDIGNTRGALVTNCVFGPRNSFFDGQTVAGSESIRVNNSEDVTIDKNNIALSNRQMVTYQNVDRFNVDENAVYAANFELTTVNDGSAEWSYEYAPVDKDEYYYYNYQYWTTGAWVRILPLWSQDKKNNEDYGYIAGANILYPGQSNDIVATYKAPYDGRVKVLFNNGLRLREISAASYRGVRFKLIKNESETIWPKVGWKLFEAEKPVDYIEDIYVNVKKGDKLRFRFNANGSHWYNNVLFRPEIVYVEQAEKIDTYNNSILKFAENTKTVYAGEENAFVLPIVNNTGASEAVFISSNEEFATVDNNGRVVPIKKGNVVITAKVGDKTCQCVVKIKDVIEEGIRFPQEYIYGEKGDKIKLHVEKTEALKDEKVTWSIPSEYYGAIDEDGVLTINTENVGKTVITARCGEYTAEANLFILGKSNDVDGGSFSSQYHFSTLNNNENSVYQYMTTNDNGKTYEHYKYNAENS